MSSKTILLYILQACILNFAYISVYISQGVNDGQHFSSIAYFFYSRNSGQRKCRKGWLLGNVNVF